MASLNQSEIIELLKFISNSKIISELVELNVITTNDNYMVVNKGTEDAKKAKIPLIRGFLGDYNADTNTPSLSNGVGIKGDTYNVSVNGVRDFGNGTISLIADDIIIYNGSKWIKLTQSQISDIEGLESALQNKLSTTLGDEFYKDENDVLRLNVSTYRQTINFVSGSQVFTLDFEPTFIIGIFINGIYIDENDYIYTTPNQLEILGIMENGDRLKVVYEHFNNPPIT